MQFAASMCSSDRFSALRASTAPTGFLYLYFVDAHTIRSNVSLSALRLRMFPRFSPEHAAEQREGYGGLRQKGKRVFRKSLEGLGRDVYEESGDHRRRWDRREGRGGYLGKDEQANLLFCKGTSDLYRGQCKHHKE